MIFHEEQITFEKQLTSVGITEKKKQELILTFLFQLAAIGYGIMEEQKIMNEKNREQ